MIYNKITLAFSEKDEALFREKYFFDSVFQFRIAFLIVIILYGVFGYLDSQMVPEYANPFHVIRYLIVIPILSIVFLLSFTGLFRKVWQVLVLISFIAGGTGISIMTMLVPDNYTYYAGMMLIFSAGYFFIKLRFFLATIAGWTTLLIFNIGAIYYAHTPHILLISNNFFFISANLIGMFAAYNIEYYARRNFFLNQKLDNEKLHVEEINKNLEKTVKERTKELVKAKDQAEESDRLKSAFLANISHEIRTPMNGILGFTELLKMGDITGEQQHEYSNIIRKSSDRMLNTIHDIVDISKIESGQMTVLLSDTNINKQIENVFAFFKPEAENKGIQLYFRNGLPSDQSIIKTDQEKLYAILTNLVKNAIKYTDKGTIEFGYIPTGSVMNSNAKAADSEKSEWDQPVDSDELSTAVAEPAKLQFYVKDTGIGIPSDRQKAVFDRFVQADIADTRAFQGTGLGLSITKAFVEMLGGRIWVESDILKGSTFYFTIPFHRDANEAIAEKKYVTVAENVFPDKKLKVLITEDDETSVFFLVIALKELANIVLKATNGVEAIETCRSHLDIDLILMDIKMPIMDGYEATRQIRRFNKNVIIIAQTAFGLTGDREMAIEAGCNDYLPKPLSKKELMQIINVYFNLK